MEQEPRGMETLALKSKTFNLTRQTETKLYRKPHMVF